MINLLAMIFVINVFIITRYSYTRFFINNLRTNFFKTNKRSKAWLNKEDGKTFDIVFIVCFLYSFVQRSELWSNFKLGSSACSSKPLKLNLFQNNKVLFSHLIEPLIIFLCSYSLFDFAFQVLQLSVYWLIF